MAISKVTFNGKTIVDISKDSVTSDTLFLNATAHSRDGNKINGNVIPMSIVSFYVDSNGILHLSDDG